MSETKREYWSKLIAEQPSSGLTIRRFCRQQGIAEHSFYQWRKRLGEASQVRFALLEPVVRSNEAALELVLSNGERLRIRPGVDAATLRMVLDSLRA